MARKGYIGKTCAYCSREGVSRVREHVICKEFFLESDRGNLPMVPACEDCDTGKSKLETYALTILPFGSRHQDAQAYAEKNLPRRLRQNPSLKREIAKGTTKVWERQGDIVLPTSAIPVDDARINSLLAMIVRGLFMHEFGFALHKNWDAKVTMFEAEVEANIMNQAKTLLGPNPVFVTRNFGRGTFVYEGGNSSIMRNLSVWQFTLFGGLLLADDTLALSRFSALTSRNDDVQGPLGDDELSV